MSAADCFLLGRSRSTATSHDRRAHVNRRGILRSQDTLAAKDLGPSLRAVASATCICVDARRHALGALQTRLPLASARIVPSVPRLFLAQLADAHAKGQLPFFGEIGLLNEELKARGIKSKSW